jgi:hypothetical protein
VGGVVPHDKEPCDEKTQEEAKWYFEHPRQVKYDQCSEAACVSGRIQREQCEGEAKRFPAESLKFGPYIGGQIVFGSSAKVRGRGNGGSPGWNFRFTYYVPGMSLHR